MGRRGALLGPVGGVGLGFGLTWLISSCIEVRLIFSAISSTIIGGGRFGTFMASSAAFGIVNGSDFVKVNELGGGIARGEGAVGVDSRSGSSGMVGMICAFCTIAPPDPVAVDLLVGTGTDCDDAFCCNGIQLIGVRTCADEVGLGSAAFCFSKVTALLTGANATLFFNLVSGTCSGVGGICHATAI